MQVRRSSRKRVIIPAGVEASLQPDDTVDVVIMVKRPGYAPPGVTVRTKVSEDIFTGVAPAKLLDQLDQDPLIKSVQVARPLKRQ